MGKGMAADGPQSGKTDSSCKIFIFGRNTSDTPKVIKSIFFLEKLHTGVFGRAII